LRIESVDRNKCLLLTTKPNLPEARNWIDANLETFVRKSIPAGINPPSSQLPRRLDKPVFSASSLSYADALKKQFSLVSTAANSTTDHTRPPRKRQAAIIDYDSDQLSSTVTNSTPAAKKPPSTTERNPNSNNAMTTSNATTTDDYAAELQLIKKEIASLRTLISSAVEQLQSAVTSIKANPIQTSASDKAMEIETDQSIDTNHSKETTPEISELITELKNDIAMIAVEM